MPKLGVHVDGGINTTFIVKHPAAYSDRSGV
jgi:hypothetical protein